MSTQQNIRFAHSRLKKKLEDGGNLKGAKERNECLAPGDPQSSCHVLSTALGKHLDLDLTVLFGGNSGSTYLRPSLVLLVPIAKRSSPKVVKRSEFSRTSAY